ncbi:MAG: hypothetical protein WCQ67_03355 [Treponema sp.]
MKNKEKSHILILSAIIFCILYIIFAFKPLGSELNLSPDWTEDISRIKKTNSKDKLIPFRLGQNIGYFTPDGKIASSISFPCKASISKTFYTTFSEDNSSAPLNYADGSLAATLNYSGFPFFDDDRIFVFLPGGSSFLQCDIRGNKIWQYESYSPITSFDSSENGTVAGYADGSIVSFTKSGKISQQFSPGGSTFAVILGTGISNDGSMIASVSGQDKQRFVLAKKDGEHSKVIFHEYLEKDQTKQVLVKFNKKDNTVYYDCNGYLGIVDIEKLKSAKIPLDGEIIQIEESSVDSLVFILSKKGTTYSVTILEPFNNSLGSFSFEADSAFIQVSGNALFVGRDTKISRLTISRK